MEEFLAGLRIQIGAFLAGCMSRGKIAGKPEDAEPCRKCLACAVYFSLMPHNQMQAQKVVPSPVLERRMKAYREHIGDVIRVALEQKDMVVKAQSGEPVQLLLEVQLLNTRLMAACTQLDALVKEEK